MSEEHEDDDCEARDSEEELDDALDVGYDDEGEEEEDWEAGESSDAAEERAELAELKLIDKLGVFAPGWYDEEAGVDTDGLDLSELPPDAETDDEEEEDDSAAPL